MKSLKGAKFVGVSLEEGQHRDAVFNFRVFRDCKHWYRRLLRKSLGVSSNREVSQRIACEVTAELDTSMLAKEDLVSISNQRIEKGKGSKAL